MKYGTLSQQMAKNGVKLRTWAKAKGLNERDIGILNQISQGVIKGKWGRAKNRFKQSIKNYKYILIIYSF